MSRVLGIETSCDETAAAVVERLADGSGVIRSNIIHSQIGDHALYGGVVPEIAARAHLARLDRLIGRAMEEAECGFGDLDAIAVTAGPGLIGGLLTGLMMAKGLAAATGRPLYAVNHLEGHALTPRLTDGLDFPYLLLLVSGGHSQFVEVRGVDDYHRLATTIDDALGEAFDKTAKLLSLPYPGGPAVEQAARKGDANRFDFPRPLSGRGELNFSFSGLKTAVRQAAQAAAPLAQQDVADICASFQQAIVDILADRTRKMIGLFEARHGSGGSRALVLAGGVAANQAIRSALESETARRGWRLIAPPPELCTDNGAMIAWAGLERLGRFEPAGFDIAPRSRWPLDEDVAGLIGSGRRGVKA
ncbi:MAG: tRNA (adenosine(37)-N6)-threonylcarbamoyltransferase complex transferase subunit TsaD [Nitratireductor sp.]|nr:tRNA (adenosine(37)-N6)-threonylcarbamoyltransferase complex transferase subunit TsaD [Nitratireductor sp.]